MTNQKEILLQEPIQPVKKKCKYVHSVARETIQ